MIHFTKDFLELATALGAWGTVTTALDASGLTRPGGLAMGPDCKSLFATGRLDEARATEIGVGRGANRPKPIS